MRVPVGDPGRDVERLVVDADAHPRRLDRAAQDGWGDRDPWTTVPTLDPGRTADRLAEHGLAVATSPEWLMTVRLVEQRRVALAPGFRVEVLAESATSVRLRVVDEEGREAALGQVGVHTGHGVPDRVSTARSHRRRGLGGAVMTLLADAAHDRGAEHGVLVASDQGRRLYASLGWTVAGAVVVARGR